MFLLPKGAGLSILIVEKVLRELLEHGGNFVLALGTGSGKAS